MKNRDHIGSFPRAILHVDGDYFFVSCELASQPWLKGLPVVTGKERGIASAMSPEAKALGITRATPIFRIRKLHPQVIVLSSNYDAYELYARRMYAIVRRYTPLVEEYSIDECFADITGRDAVLKLSYEDIARAIKYDLEKELGLSFSIGVSINKVSAKIASKWNKPSGLTLISKEALPDFLAKLSISKVWGVGRSTSTLLRKQGIVTAYDFISRNPEWVDMSFAKPVRELYEELRGGYINSVHTGSREEYISISRTRTFTPPSSNREFVFSELSKNVEAACARLRRWGYHARWFSFFIKTQEFRYYRLEARLPRATDAPQDILPVIRSRFGEIFKSGILYRASGITVGDLVKSEGMSGNLFDQEGVTAVLGPLYENIDELTRRFGSNSIFLGSSFKALHHDREIEIRSRADRKNNRRILLKYTDPRLIGIPFLGTVS